MVPLSLHIRIAKAKKIFAFMVGSIYCVVYDDSPIALANGTLQSALLWYNEEH